MDPTVTLAERAADLLEDAVRSGGDQDITIGDAADTVATLSAVAERASLLAGKLEQRLAAMETGSGKRQRHLVVARSHLQLAGTKLDAAIGEIGAAHRCIRAYTEPS